MLHDFRGRAYQLALQPLLKGVENAADEKMDMDADPCFRVDDRLQYHSPEQRGGEYG